jgi:hypothetical protein
MDNLSFPYTYPTYSIYKSGRGNNTYDIEC